MKFMKLVARFVVGVALAVAAASAGLSAFFFVAGRDIDPPDVSDVLPPPRQPIADAENMVPILLDATNRLALTKDDKYFINCCYRKDGWDRRLRLADADRTLTAQEATAWADIGRRNETALNYETNRRYQPAFFRDWDERIEKLKEGE